MRLVFISSVTAMTPLRTISVTTASGRRDLGAARLFVFGFFVIRSLDARHGNRFMDEPFTLPHAEERPPMLKSATADLSGRISKHVWRTRCRLPSFETAALRPPQDEV